MTTTSPLTLTERRTRGATIVFVAALLGALRLCDPVKVGPYLPWPTSCGAVTGLPCLFCGMTRAMHSLLQGEVARACYLNWLSVPLLVALLGIVVACLCELTNNRKRIAWQVLVPRTPRSLLALATALIFLWSVQAYLAVSYHKTELLNPRGLLYPVFVRS